MHSCTFGEPLLRKSGCETVSPDRLSQCHAHRLHNIDAADTSDAWLHKILCSMMSASSWNPGSPINKHGGCNGVTGVRRGHIANIIEAWSTRHCPGSGCKC